MYCCKEIDVAYSVYTWRCDISIVLRVIPLCIKQDEEYRVQDCIITAVVYSDVLCPLDKLLTNLTEADMTEILKIIQDEIDTNFSLNFIPFDSNLQDLVDIRTANKEEFFSLMEDKQSLVYGNDDYDDDEGDY